MTQRHTLTTLRSAQELSKTKPHGTRLKYKGGCKCVPCRAANSRYESERLAARKSGNGNGIVSAQESRTHLLKLQAKGIGRRTIHDICGVAQNIIVGIRNGERPNVRKSTEQRILSVGLDALPDSALVSAKPTWKILRWLMSQGLDEATLAKRLGYAGRSLQIKKTYITAKTAIKVERFYNRMMVE